MTWTRPYQALNTMMVFVVSMVGNSEQICIALSFVDLGASRLEAPYTLHSENLREVTRVTG